MAHCIHRKINLSKELVNLYSDHTEKSTRPSCIELAKIFEIECRSLSHVFIVLDALDECTDKIETRTKILTEVAKLPKVRLMATGRPYVTKTVISKWGNAEVSELPITAKDEDIEKYAKNKLDLNENLSRYCRRDPSLKDTIPKTVVSKAKGM